MPHRAARPVDDCSEVANFVLTSVDIEAVAVADENGRYPFPDASRPDNPISCICATLDRLHADEGEVHGFTYAAVDRAAVARDDPRLVVHECGSEAEMLRAFVAWFETTQPDAVVGYNILGFDLAYLHRRCEHCGVSLRHLGKFDLPSAPRLRQVSLSVGGSHFELSYFEVAGVLPVDMYVLVKRDFKLQSYGLGAVGSHFIGLSKIDLPPKEIFRQSVAGPAGLANVLVYCARDVDVPMRVARKLNSLVKMMQFATMARVRVDDLLVRGENYKTLSVLADAAATRGWVLADAAFAYNQLDGKYQGALVLEPVEGLHDDEPTATLDFKSLYPSMMISQRLCPHTFVADPAYLGLPGDEYKLFAWTDDTTGRYHAYHFAVNQEALVPDVLMRLAAERSRAKKAMKACARRADEAAARGDASAAAAARFEESVCDGTQLSVKLVMNAIYGFFGAAQIGKLPHVPVAQTITFCGRQMLLHTQRYIFCRYAQLPSLLPGDAGARDGAPFATRRARSRSRTSAPTPPI